MEILLNEPVLSNSQDEKAMERLKGWDEGPLGKKKRTDEDEGCAFKKGAGTLY